LIVGVVIAAIVCCAIVIIVIIVVVRRRRNRQGPSRATSPEALDISTPIDTTTTTEAAAVADVDDVSEWDFMRDVPMADYATGKHLQRLVVINPETGARRVDEGMIERNRRRKKKIVEKSESKSLAKRNVSFFCAAFRI
jgi:hypothetical protein